MTGRHIENSEHVAEQLVFRPVTRLPYVIGAIFLAMGLLMAIQPVSTLNGTTDFASPIAAIVFIGIAIMCIITRFAGFPRILVKDNVLSLEGYLG